MVLFPGLLKHRDWNPMKCRLMLSLSCPFHGHCQHTLVYFIKEVNSRLTKLELTLLGQKQRVCMTVATSTACSWLYMVTVDARVSMCTYRHVKYTYLLVTHIDVHASYVSSIMYDMIFFCFIQIYRQAKILMESPFLKNTFACLLIEMSVVSILKQTSTTAATQMIWW